MTDEQAVALAREGDEAGFRELFERHKAGVYGIAYRYSGSAQDAEDILQETFIKVFREIRRAGESGRPVFDAWIHRVCYHRCIEHLRKRKRRRSSLTESLSETPDPRVAGGPSPERSADAGLMLEKVNCAIGVLSPQQRIIFDLRYNDHRDIAEISAALRCSESAVKTTLSRAMAKLRDRLAPIVEEL
jgi:RNA polymerase sigma-70 factor (ECF subfamily)